MSKSVKNRSSKGRKSRRGGFLGNVLNQAMVPVALLGMQQTYGKKRRGGKHRGTKRRGTKRRH